MAAEKPKPLNVLQWNKKGDFKVVVGIDFGTDGSAVAWALNDGSDEVHIAQEMNDNSRFVDLKAKTNILLNDKGEFIAFGREATEQYIRQFEDHDSDDDHASNKKKASWLYFDQFKMALYKKAIKKQALVTPGGDEEKKANDNNDEQFKADIKSSLTAANGKKLSSRTVFIQALKFIKQHTYKMFEKNKINITNKNEIKWVLSVPAIWSDKSKGLMERWAVEAGLITDTKLLNQLVIAYEPDCASISIQNEIKDYKKLLEKKKRNPKKQNKDDGKEEKEPKKDKKKQPAAKQYLSAGEKYLLLDLGGGTADIACHQVIDDFHVKEIYRPTGDAWGSTYIDKHFIRLLTDLLPRGWIQQFRAKHPSDYTMLKRNFQRAKETFYARELRQKRAQDPSIEGYNKQQAHNIILPVEFIEFLEEKLEEYNLFQQQKNQTVYSDIADYIKQQDFLGSTNKWILEENVLQLDYAVWIHIFDDIVDKIVDHCKELLKKEPLKDGQCRYCCLVGGFSSSKYVQSRIMYELGVKSCYRLIVIVPKRPWLSVVDGAVRLGLKPDYIQSRIVAKTYGIKVNAPISKFKLSDLEDDFVKKNRYFNKRAKQEYLHEIFHAYVHRGDEIKITEPPKTARFYASQANIVGIDVYDSDKQNPICIEGKPITRKDFILPENWDIHTAFPISFFFGDTKIRVFADIDGIEDHEKEIKLEYEFNQ